jgi:hypothetical protein
MPNQWLAADDRQVNRAVPGDEPEDPIDELVAPRVVQLSERDAPTEMPVFVRVTPGTVQRALPRDLD